MQSILEHLKKADKHNCEYKKTYYKRLERERKVAINKSVKRCLVKSVIMYIVSSSSSHYLVGLFLKGNVSTKTIELDELIKVSEKYISKKCYG